jgi:hypothetical protein
MNRWWRLLATAALLAVVAGVSFLTSPPSLHTQAVTVALAATVLVLVSVVAYAWLRRYLALATSVAAISLVWAALAALDATLASTCPGNQAGDLAACTPKEVIGQAGVALLLPLIPLVVVLPARSLWRSMRTLHHHVANTIAGDSSPRSTSTAKNNSPSTKKEISKGRTTPKGTRPPPRRSK